ncbi:protein ALP1-like, partial [Aphis craccivora]
MDYDYYMNAMKVIAVAEAFGYLNPSRSERSYWIHPFNIVRETNNRFFPFYGDIRKYPNKFVEYYRMYISSFDELLEKLRPYITKKTTKFRRPVCAEERLTITIR